jgi:hypothetical protein
LPRQLLLALLDLDFVAELVEHGLVELLDRNLGNTISRANQTRVLQSSKH